VVAGPGTVKSEQAVSIGLIVTELVINALKYAFPVDIAVGHIVVGYEVKGAKWTLSVSDNGGGMQENLDKKSTGLGTTLVKALAQQLEAQVDIKTGDNGTIVSITHPKV
jgi:two-component sensor histidine kinase